MQKNKKRTYPFLSIVWKIAALLFIGLFLYAEVTYLMDSIKEHNVDTYDQAEQIRFLDNYYYEGKYGDVRKLLSLYDLYDDIYDKYWEAADGNLDYLEYRQWKRAEAAGVEGSAAQVEQYREKVLANAENCQFSSNQRQLEEYADAVKSE